MKKNFKYFAITWLVGFVLFNAITFLIPNEVFGETRFDKGVFWVAYVFIGVSFIVQLLTAYKFIKDDSDEKMFLNIPLLKTGYIVTAVAVLIGLVFMVFPIIPSWIGAIVCLLIAGYFVIACVNASTVANVIAEVGEKVKTKTAFMRLAVVEAENIMERATTSGMKSETAKVYEALRYSDYMSVPELETIEQSIDDGLKEFKKAVMGNDDVKVECIARELLLLIKERNSKCKLLK